MKTVMFKDKVRIANQTLKSRVSIGIHSWKNRLGKLFMNNPKEASFCRRNKGDAAPDIIQRVRELKMQPWMECHHQTPPFRA